MPSRNPIVDRYIQEAAPFARPILRRLREVIHGARPDLEETIKWGMPHFEHRGILCSIAAFKGHCALTFWNAPEVVGDDAVAGAMGEFGRITSLDELPSDETIRRYVRRAWELREAGVTQTRPSKGPKPPLEVPEALLQTLRQDTVALEGWEGFSDSQKREYAEWIADARREATRERRLQQAVEWIRDGKPRNWKYR